jgi:hypothetical protein
LPHWFWSYIFIFPIFVHDLSQSCGLSLSCNLFLNIQPFSKFWPIFKLSNLFKLHSFFWVYSWLTSTYLDLQALNLSLITPFPFVVDLFNVYLLQLCYMSLCMHSSLSHSLDFYM